MIVMCFRLSQSYDTHSDESDEFSQTDFSDEVWDHSGTLDIMPEHVTSEIKVSS